MVFVILAVVAGGLAYWKMRPQPAPPAFEPMEAVQAVEARTTSWRATAQLSGTVIALQSVDLSNEVPGRIIDVKFESGQIVEAGAVLVTLDDSTERSDLLAAEANVRVAEANVEVTRSNIKLAESNVRRLEPAVTARAASATELDQATSALDAAKATLTRSQAEVDQAKARAEQVRTLIAKKTLRAPFRAHVGLRNIHPGQFLAEGTKVAMLQSVDDRIYLDFALPQEQASLAKPGMSVMATAPMLGKDPVKIDVVALDAAANPETRNVRVRAVVPNSDQGLRPGMFVDIVAPYGESRDYVVVPSTAVRRASFGDHVFVIEADAKDPQKLRAHQRFIKTGPMIGNDLIVMEGLKLGERVAANGSFKLREGVAVTIGPPPSPVAPAAGDAPKAAASGPEGK